MKEAMLYEKLSGKKVHCYLCAHHCKIAPGRVGFCGVRQNQEGSLYSLVYAKAIAAQVDPIEKKPLYHFHPGSKTYSIATVGCNFRCGFCQNWQISQHPGGLESSWDFTPEEVVAKAKETGCLSIAYTYSEPTIFFEYAYDTAKLAKARGLKNVFVTNGYMTSESISLIRPYLDAANIDLKSFREEFYRKTCQAHLAPVLDSIRLMKEAGIWIEITTLLIPGENDAPEELKELAAFIAEIGKDIPWHISRFHPDYKFLDYPLTSREVLEAAKVIGEKAGLRYVYLGNV